jgi:glycosyltransferase involved in cell wall biosynthesis
MKTVFTHPTGNANVKAAAKSLMEYGLLSQFATSIASFPGSFLDNLGAFGPLSEIRRRRFDRNLKPVTCMRPAFEVGRLLAGKAGLKRLTKHETGIFSVDVVYRNLDKKVALSLPVLSKQGTKAIYAYEDAAASSFRMAKSLGLRCLYDLPIGYWRVAKQLLDAEKERWPDWNSTLVGLSDSDAKLSRKDEELMLADKIFVASQFTAKTLQSFQGELAPIEVIPYGFPSVTGKRDYSSFSRNSRPLKLLFVGGLSQRKGIAELFAAVKTLNRHVELTVVGNKVTDNCPALDAELAKHRWIPTLHHQGILELMRSNDVFVFPSLFEGFGLVISEAMSQGTPVITTERTAGPDLIRHDENGWLIEAGSTEKLIAAIEKLLYNPGSIISAGKAAMETARARPWDVYGTELARAVTKSISN